MEIDTGAAVSLISESMWRSLFPDTSLRRSVTQLRTYTADPITVLGELPVQVRYHAYEGEHTLIVVSGDGPALIGRDWLEHIRLNWANIYSIATSAPLQQMAKFLDSFSAVFQEGLGTMTAHLILRKGATPKFRRPYPVPFAVKDAVGRELDRFGI